MIGHFIVEGDVCDSLFLMFDFIFYPMSFCFLWLELFFAHGMVLCQLIQYFVDFNIFQNTSCLCGEDLIFIKVE